MSDVQPKMEEKLKAYRILLIDEAIRSGSYPNSETLALKLEVSSRTIQRYIEFLRDTYRAPLEYDYTRRGYYYTEPNFFIKSVMLTEGELFSLAIFEPLLAQYRQTPIEQNLRDIIKKIVQSLPQNISVDSSLLGSRISFIPDPPVFLEAASFLAVFTALKVRKTLAFEYRSLQNTSYTKRKADPYHAICHRGNWYFIGHCHTRNEIRLFSCSRLRKAAIINKPFTVPKDFNPYLYFDKQMGVWASARTPFAVELLFENEIGTYAAERQWHDTQTIRQYEDGRVYVKFTTTQVPEVLRWVLGQGHTVKVLGPPELAVMVKEEIEKVRGMY
ncbi:YafY family transcriptional regulator [Treponema sp. TIM-1]|uniref:helix-turn-helix transcriptional regulator n=1 Tax=Treponema sp. TIM-1 TaxID=2898417 RepID=UPI003980A491